MRYFLLAVLTGASIASAFAQSRNLAPGFTNLPRGTVVAIMPIDLELFSISGGGVHEPRADWTEAASQHFKKALLNKRQALGLEVVEVSERDADQLAEITSLHAAVAAAISLHHFGTLPLPTKQGKLDWSMGEPVRAVKKLTGADYALFTWVRDSYTSAERQAAMVGIALLTLGRAIPLGGQQVGYASLIELDTGQVVWFNRLARPGGDLRELDRAAETLDQLLAEFPAAK